MPEYCIRFAVVGLLVVVSAAAHPNSFFRATELNGHFELDFESERNFDLLDRREDDFSRLRPELQLSAGVASQSTVSGYLQVELRKEIAFESSADNDAGELELLLEEIYFDVAPLGSLERLRIGRQDFDDPREWLYDEELDGLRAFFQRGRFSLELSVSRRRLVSEDLLNRDKRTRVNNYHAYATYALSDDANMAAYWLAQDDLSADGESPIFWGIRSLGRLSQGLDHWLELAHVRGRDGRRRIRGFGLDIGATYHAAFTTRPYVTVAFALGSGDSSPGNNTDSAFR